MPAPYFQTEIKAALQSPVREWAFRYERLIGGTNVEDEIVTSCTVKHSDLADIKRTCDVVLRADSEFDPLVDLFRPYVQLRMADGGWHEWLMGTFFLQSSTRKTTASAGNRLSPRGGMDGTLRLQDDKMLDRFVVPAGEPYTDAVKELLLEVGLPTTSVTGSLAVLPAAMEWEPGTTRLQVLNDLLAAINYRAIRFNAAGQPVATPYVDPSTAPVLWRYDRGSTSSVMRPDGDVEFDLFEVPNRWIGYVSKPETVPLRSVLSNDNPFDPLSTVGRGRAIVEVIDTARIGDAPTQEILDAAVARAAQEDRSRYETITFDTALMPIHDAGDVCEVETDDGLFRYRETEWVLPMYVGASMSHTMRRAVAL